MRFKLTDQRAQEAHSRIESGSDVTAVARDLGITRQGLYKRFRKLGLVVTAKRAILTVTCTTCSREFERRRCHARAVHKQYCSSECYRQAIRRPEYRQHRQSSRKARRVVREFYRLLDTDVVHHMDGDDTNNEPSNLMVFGSHADHMRWHRAGGWESGVVYRWYGGRRP